MTARPAPRHGSTTKPAFAALAAGWMLLAMQPCLAALELPTTAHGDHHDCSHCPPELAPPCADGAVDCAGPDALSGADQGQPKPAVITALVSTTAPGAPVIGHAAFRHARPESTGPPLTERFCCHLE